MQHALMHAIDQAIWPSQNWAQLYTNQQRSAALGAGWRIMRGRTLQDTGREGEERAPQPAKKKACSARKRSKFFSIRAIFVPSFIYC